jgi:hypothetical protein
MLTFNSRPAIGANSRNPRSVAKEAFEEDEVKAENTKAGVNG